MDIKHGYKTRLQCFLLARREISFGFSLFFTKFELTIYYTFLFDSSPNGILVVANINRKSMTKIQICLALQRDSEKYFSPCGLRKSS